MKVIIVGAGRTGSQLARELMGQGHEVKVVEFREEIVTRIHRELPTESIVEGNYTDMAALEAAGIQEADVVAATSTNDDANLTVCYLAREKYGVRRTIARVNNPRDAWLFNDTFHVDVAVNQAAIMTRLIEEEMSMGDMMTLLKLRRGNYSLVEEKIPEGARAIGAAIKDLKLPEHCVIAAIIRKGEVMIPRGVTTFMAGDEVLAITDPDGAVALAELFAGPRPVRSKPSAV